MVGFEEIQAAYYMVAATGVLVAAASYLMNLRNSVRERRARMPVAKMVKNGFYSSHILRAVSLSC